jgi:hypothetical protein
MLGISLEEAARRRFPQVAPVIRNDRVKQAADALWMEMTGTFTNAVKDQMRGMIISDTQAAAAVQLFKQAGVATQFEPRAFQEYLLGTQAVLSTRGKLLADIMDIAFRGGTKTKADITEFKGLSDISDLLSHKHPVISRLAKAAAGTKGTTYAGPDLPPQFAGLGHVTTPVNIAAIKAFLRERE